VTTEQLYLIETFIANKHQAGDISPAEFGRINNMAQDMYLSFLLGDPERSLGQRGIPYVSAQSSKSVDTRLSPLLVPKRKLAIISGYIPFPNNCVMISSVDVNGITARYEPDYAISYAKKSSVCPPERYPFYSVSKSGISVYCGDTAADAEVSYYEKPRPIVYGWDLVDGRPKYSQSKSSDPIWPDISMAQVIARAMSFIGVHLEASAVMGIAQDIKQSGQ